jgi:hypothetical protein
LKLPAPRLARALGAAAITGALLAPLAAPASAHAAVTSPPYFNRKDVLTRAMTWTRAKVPYSQTGWLNGYRTDCSGFISMAWGLDQSYVTWTLPEVARPISRDELQPGDIMLNTADHVVLFERWIDRAHTRYVVLEEAGSTDRAVRRQMVYPFWTSPGEYKPYRYVGGHNLHDPANPVKKVQIQTYAGGAPIVPPWVTALKGGKGPATASAAGRPAGNPVSVARARARAIAVARARAVAIAKARARAIQLARYRAVAEAKERAHREALDKAAKQAAAQAAQRKAAEAKAAEAKRNSIGATPLVVTLLRGFTSLFKQ